MTSPGAAKGIEYAEARAKIAAMSPQLGREVRVFLNPAAVLPAEDARAPSGESEQSPGEEPEEFYELTVADYARISQSRKEAVFLKTKKIRDAEAAAAMSRITKAVVRTQFPDGWILEASFQPSDPISAVRELVQRCIARPELPFYFYTTPPKQRIKDEGTSLYVAGLTPGALIHFAYEAPKGGSPAQQGATLEGPFLREEVAELRDLHWIEQPEEAGASGRSQEGARAEAASAAAETAPSAAPPVKAQDKQPGRPKWFKPK